LKVQRGYKTELDLNNKQKTACLQHAGAARFTYNWGLAQKKAAMELKVKIPNAIELHRRLKSTGNGTTRETKMIDFTDETFAQEIKEGIVVADFWAPWCRPCQSLKKVLEAVEPNFPSIKFGKVNIDECPVVTEQNAVSAVPTIKVFKDGVQVRSILGVQKQESIEAILKDLA